MVASDWCHCGGRLANSKCRCNCNGCMAARRCIMFRSSDRTFMCDDCK